MDEEIIQRMKEGDKAAFDLFYEKYKNVAMHTVYLIVGNKADSEDVVQESFIRCYEHISALKHNEKFKGWFFHILTRTAWEYGKKKNKEVPQEDMSNFEKQGVEPSAAEIAMAKERAASIMRLVEDLPLKHRTVVVLYYYNEFSTKEIAKIVGCLEGTVKSRLFTARRKLKEALLNSQNGKEEVYDEEIRFRQRDCRSV